MQRVPIAIGSPGFCALRLAQRLLDPVPAGNCKLQTLRQYYRLPERGAHTALGDVQTVADLVAHVLQPIAGVRGLDTWEKLVQFAAEEWYPSRISFGKHKGRLIQEASRDAELRRWLDWLASSANARSTRMGRWYLRQLEIIPEPEADGAVFAAPAGSGERQPATPSLQTETAALVIYINPVLEEIRELVAGARARLAELEASYTGEKARVDAVQAVLFRRLCQQYQKRDRLRLLVEYRRRYLDLLLRGGEDDAKQAEAEYKQARAQSEKDYEETAAAVAQKQQLTAEEEAELTQLWKKLVKLYHPDRFAHEPDKLETYHRLTSAINRAKDAGDIKTLREIANDPHGYILRQGWASLDFSDEAELSQLRQLYETLQLEIITVLDSLNRLRESAEYELCQLSQQNAGILEELAAQRKQLLEKEAAELETQAAKLAEEIKELSGADTTGIV